MSAMDDTMIKSQPGPQMAFLRSSADITFYGGAAGGGKTYALLLEPIFHIDNPDFGAVIFRQTYPQIMQEGGMWDESARLYTLLGAQQRAMRLEWRFPSGARVRFAYMQYENDKYRHQGAQIPLIGFDQAEQFSAGQFFFMLSRNRSMCGVKPYVRATCNPDPDSWLAGFLSWWIDQDSGYARQDRAGHTRWFVRSGDELVWGDTREELAERFRAVEGIQPKSVTFIPASVRDNKILLERDPGYLANLMALPTIDRERLLEGNWKIRPEAGLLFNRGWFEIIPAAPRGGKMCRFWDLAATKKEMKKADPDRTAGVLQRQTEGLYIVEDCIEVTDGPAEVDRLLVNTASQDFQRAQETGARYMVRWEQEPGASGKRDSARIMKMLAGYDAAPIRPQGDKVVRAKPLSSQAFAGNVKLLAGPWNEAWLTHMHNQPQFGHDDIMDASSGGHNVLTRSPYVWARGAAG